MVSSSLDRLPTKIEVARVVSSRYSGAARPLAWDARVEGVDVVESGDGRALKLRSTGQQSTPQPGWVIVLTSGNADSGFRWTLYGLPKGSAAAAH